MPTDLDQQLIAAAWKNDVAAARRLITAGADVNAVDDTVQSAFLIAASEGYVELLDLTLQHGGDVRSLDSYRGTALIRAAERGHAAVVGRLLQAGVAVDHVNRLGWTALHEAVLLGEGTPQYVETVRLLVAAGADRAKPAQRDGVTPVQGARKLGQKAVSAVLEAERPGSPAAALLGAATAGDADAAAAALAAGASIESADGQRRTALLLAALNDRVEVARLLVGLGADPDAQDDRKDSAWLVTGVTGSVAMLETLLPARPDLALRNRYGGVSVIPASERGHVEYVRRVVRTGINVNHVNDLGWTALLEAVILGKGSEAWQEIVKILLAAGADPAIADRDGVTALQHAEKRGYDKIAAILREAKGR
ncbi:ankyrin repeat domain-containing protein [Kribbella sp. NPDC051770]|uniref:ankyrin repeat domain-containing protein n=1 Tax=Kribbella sp. NPDC051770 TaxID=3155413 RepID=UPI00343D3633